MIWSQSQYPIVIDLLQYDIRKSPGFVCSLKSQICWELSFELPLDVLIEDLKCHKNTWTCR